jgi:branched-chain amino acid transport system ATP-binding protein
MLRVEDLHKSFDEFKAVNGAHLTVEKGQLVAVIGPNGAGKTTLFNLITGQLKPDNGEILLNDEDIGKLPPHVICRKGIARSFQIANVFHRLSVFRNVQISVLSQRKLSNKLFAGSLSHGDKRTLEIAIALGNEPHLLILDEPTAGMSPEETATTMALIQRLAADHGLTILFCEHDMEVVFGTAQSIMVMQQGRTIVQGDPQTVRQNTEVQQAYLGDE